MTSVSRIDDGRRKRGDHSRKQIVDAMLVLVREGDMSPSAAQVAERAGVGLRTVFRHFEEMEVLYREMAEVIAAKVMPLVRKPYTKAAWRDRLLELVERRIEIHEEIMPLKIAGSVLRFRSKFLMDDYRAHLKLERESLESILPDSVKKDQTLFRAVEMVTSFQAWRRLRQDQDLSVSDARKVMLKLIDGTLGAAK
ncbi:MAG: TetR/AcrR family transcriptional regulator [Micropepsaceae bacterium]